MTVEIFDTRSSEEFWAKPKEEISIPHKNKQYFIFIMVGEQANIRKLTTYKENAREVLPGHHVNIRIDKFISYQEQNS